MIPPVAANAACSTGNNCCVCWTKCATGLLAGGIPRLTLNRLASAVSARRDGFSDPKLQSVLDEIELRARVELAKLEQSERPAA